VRRGFIRAKTGRIQHNLVAAEWMVRGVGLGFGARYYTDQPGDLLDTLSLPAYCLIDTSLFYRRGIWVGR
jgi:hypothetical protein